MSKRPEVLSISAKASLMRRAEAVGLRQILVDENVILALADVLAAEKRIPREVTFDVLDALKRKLKALPREPGNPEPCSTTGLVETRGRNRHEQPI